MLQCTRQLICGVIKIDRYRRCYCRMNYFCIVILLLWLIGLNVKYILSIDVLQVSLPCIIKSGRNGALRLRDQRIDKFATLLLILDVVALWIESCSQGVHSLFGSFPKAGQIALAVGDHDD